MQDAFKAVHNYRRSTSCAGRVQRLERQTKKHVPSSAIKEALLRDQSMKASTRLMRAQTTTPADASTHAPSLDASTEKRSPCCPSNDEPSAECAALNDSRQMSPQIDGDASLMDYWAEVFNRQWDMEPYAEFQWLCVQTHMPCVSGNQWLQLGQYRQHVLRRLL